RVYATLKPRLKFAVSRCHPSTTTSSPSNRVEDQPGKDFLRSPRRRGAPLVRRFDAALATPRDHLRWRSKSDLPGAFAEGAARPVNVLGKSPLLALEEGLRYVTSPNRLLRSLRQVRRHRRKGNRSHSHKGSRRRSYSHRNKRVRSPILVLPTPARILDRPNPV